MADLQTIEIMGIITIILTIERATVEQRIPIQVIEVVDKWLDHQ